MEKTAQKWKVQKYLFLGGAATLSNFFWKNANRKKQNFPKTNEWEATNFSREIENIIFGGLSKNITIEISLKDPFFIISG